METARWHPQAHEGLLGPRLALLGGPRLARLELVERLEASSLLTQENK